MDNLEKLATQVTQGAGRINVREYQKGQSKIIDNPEKLATYGTQNKEKQSKNTTQYELGTTMRKETQIT